MNKPRQIEVNETYALFGFLVGMIVGLGIAEVLYHAYCVNRIGSSWNFQLRDMRLYFFFVFSSGVVGLAATCWRRLGEIGKQVDECEDGVP